MWLVAAVTLFFTASASIVLTPPGGTIAVWWPAAGLSALFALFAPRRARWGIFVVVVVVLTAANAAGGRDLPSSFAFGVANAVEVWVFIAIVDGRDRSDNRFLLSSVRHAVRFALAVVAGSTTLGFVISGTVAIGGGSFTETFIHVAPSHAAAILMIAPFAALPPNIMKRIPWGEMVIQAIILFTTLGFLAVAGARVPLSFLPVGLLAWGSYRLPIRGAYTETLIVGVAVLGMTMSGYGPFSEPSLSPSVQTAFATLFLFIIAASNLFLSTASYEIRDANRAATTYSGLFTRGLLNSRVAVIIAERLDDRWHIVLSNTAADELLQDPVMSEQWRQGGLRQRVGESLASGMPFTFETPDGRSLTIHASPVDDDDVRVTVQIIDITGTVRATRAQLVAEKEHNLALTERLELDRRQQDFVATASHELRTPITSISGYLELLEEEELPAEARTWTAVIRNNTQRLAALVEDLLALSRATHRSAHEHDVARLSARELAEEVRTTFLCAANDRGVDLVITGQDGVVTGVRSEITRALNNLVSNAVKFTPRDGRVEIATRPGVDTLTQPGGGRVAGTAVVVTDTGPGIDTLELDHVFERFYRTPAAQRENTPGTGLGLAIARELAHANGGSLSVESPDGKGVVATLLLPADPVPSHRHTPRQEDQQRALP
ncbi:hypothetical protein GCM10009808_09920 [Microbacterium sediminicola]|uniref:histidine kinase n=1 Tax=Microbacterium sediminicola TaxID=415210 RepID=A0ABP4TXV4_9MICO